jgi:imidazolonepropionase-like amidohydrolase
MRRRAFLQAAGAGVAGLGSLAGSPAQALAQAQVPDPGRGLIAGGTVLHPDGKRVEGALVAFDRGLISSVSTGKQPAADASTFDARGKLVTAGFVDLDVQVGLVEIELEPTARTDAQGGTDAIRAAFLAADGYDPASFVIPVTRMAGITSVGVVPAGGLVSGQSAWADLDGETAAEALASRALALHVNLAAGEDGPPMGIAAALRRLRAALDDARFLRKNRPSWEKNAARALSADARDIDALGRALDGKQPVCFRVDRAADILSVLELARAERLRAVLVSAAEAWKVAPAIARANVPVIVHPLDHGPRAFDARFADEANAARLHKAGVQVILSTGETANARKLRQEAGNAVRAGLPAHVALDAVTRGPARAMGMESRYGTLERGKVANVVVWSGDPLELSTRVEAVFIRGRRVPLRSRQTALFERYRAAQPR